MAEQLIVNFEFLAHQSFASFFAGNNEEIVNHLRASAEGLDSFLIYLWGADGLGKTHLLSASCKHAHGLKRSVFYLDLMQAKADNAGLLIGLDTYDLVCLDNIHAVAGMLNWEHELFHFFNLPRHDKQRLIVAADCHPSQLKLNLNDLTTRLNWGLTLKLQSFNDEQILAALRFKATHMGFDLSEAAAKFLLTHYQKDWVVLSDLLEKLAHASLAKQRKLTLSFVKKALIDASE